MLSCGTSFSVALQIHSYLVLVVCMHVCEHTTSHHFNVKIALNISGLGALHTGRDAL